MKTKYSKETAARLGKMLLVLTPKELGQFTSKSAGGGKIRVEQLSDPSQGGILRFYRGSRLLCEAHCWKGSKFVVRGQIQPPWFLEEANVCIWIRNRLSSLVRYSERNNPSVAWRELGTREHRVLEARRPGRVLGSIIPDGNKFALFIDGKKIGRSVMSVMLLKQRAAQCIAK